MTAEELFKIKNTIGDERDLCAELYNLWITRLYDCQGNKEKYEMYINLISNLEPYTNLPKGFSPEEELSFSNPSWLTKPSCKYKFIPSVDI